MQSTSRRSFEKFLSLSLRAAIGFVIFSAVTSVFLAVLGWSQIALPTWVGAVVGLLAALYFDRLFRKSFDWQQLEVWQDAPTWQFCAVVGAYFLVLALVACFLLSTFSLDPLCHHGITNSILAFGVPARDLGSPDRLLPYHALSNLLAAALASAVHPINPSAAVEISLDIVSISLLAIFLAIASVCFVLLRGVFGAGCGSGPLWLCFIYPLLVLGAGPVALAHFVPAVFNIADCYADFRALAFHPLLQYLGRRSAVAGFAIFLLLVCVLLFFSKRAFAGRFCSLAIIAACFVTLAYSSLDMFAASLFLVGGGLFVGALRRPALVGVAGLAAAVPFIAIQGGFITASLLNMPLPDAKGFSVWELRPPTLVGFFYLENLLGIPLSNALSWLVLAVDFPYFLLSLPLACFLLLREKPSASRAWILLLLAISAIMVTLPFFVLFVFSPWDIHRLFFWPTLFAAILTPFVLEAYFHSTALRVAIATMLLAFFCSSALVSAFVRAASDEQGLLGRTAAEFRSSLGFDPQRGHTWISSAGGQDLLFMNGCRVIAPAFGTAGSIYYGFSRLRFDAYMQSRLAMNDAGGASMALLTPDDLGFLLRNWCGKSEILRRFDIVNNGQPMTLFVVRLVRAPITD